jgi:NAD(P)-dependent dehydrogenase (short-subunit alcohol dehydrogenase family)
MVRQALVTGGAHPIGIGMAAARALVRDGFDVIVTGISEAEISLTPEEPGITAAVLDVRDSADVEALVAKLARLDALVNCAGTTGGSEWTMEEFARTVDINLNGTMRVCLAALPLLEESRGAVVNIGSMYSYFGSARVPGYAASKGGVVQLTKSQARAWGPKGIRVNAIAPGWIRTGMAQPAWEDPKYERHIARRTSLGRWGEPEECGEVIAFLCSPAARYVTGVTVPVDGGYLLDG